MISLDEFISPYLLKQILIWIISIFSFITLILITILILQKTLVEYLERKKNKLKKKYLTLINNYLFGNEKEIIKPKTNLQKRALTEVATELMTNLKGNEKEKMILYIEKSGLIKYYVKRAGSHWWPKRYFAIEQLGYFESDSLKNFYIKIIKKEKQIETKLKAIWALSLISDINSMYLIVDELSKIVEVSLKFVEDIFCNILRSLNKRNLIDGFLYFFKKLKFDNLISNGFKSAIILACGEERIFESEEIIFDYFNYFDEDDQIKKACIIAISKIGGKISSDIIKFGLVDKNPEIRTESARCAQYVTKDIIPYLKDSLYDFNIDVRINSARSLAKLGLEGIEILKNESNSKNPYVSTLSKLTLKEEGIIIA